MSIMCLVGMYLRAKNILRGLKVIGFSQTEYKWTGTLYKTICKDILYLTICKEIINLITPFIHVCWSEHSDSSFVYRFMSLDYGLGTMNTTT